MADFMTAVKWMKEGKKVRREYWVSNLCCFEGTGTIEFNSSGKSLLFDSIEATDWEIYEEDNWNLADEEVVLFSGAFVPTKNDEHSKGKGLIFTKDFKTFIQKVKEDIKQYKQKKRIPLTDYDVDLIIDKRSGNLQ